jgi:hypothetical protein
LKSVVIICFELERLILTRSRIYLILDCRGNIIVETPIPKAKRSGIGKLNNPAQRRVNTPQLAAESFPKACFVGFIPVINQSIAGAAYRGSQTLSPK